VPNMKRSSDMWYSAAWAVFLWRCWRIYLPVLHRCPTRRLTPWFTRCVPIRLSKVRVGRREWMKINLPKLLYGFPPCCALQRKSRRWISIHCWRLKSRW
jgi:Acyl-CoA synthetase (NDP forming)